MKSDLLFLLDLIEQILITLILYGYLTSKFRGYKNLLCYIFTTLLLMLGVRVLNSIIFFEGTYIFVVVLILSVVLKLLTKNGIFEITLTLIFLFLFIYFNSFFCLNLVSVAFKVDMHIIYDNELYYVLAVLLTKINLSILLLVITKLRKYDNNRIKRVKWTNLFLLICLIFVISLIFFDRIFYNEDQFSDYIGLLCTFVLFIFAVNVYKTINAENKKMMYYEKSLQKMMIERKLYENLKLQYDEIHKLRHDMKFILRTLQSRINGRKLKEAEKIIIDYDYKLSSIKNVLLTGNEDLDFIINYEISKAEDLNKKIINSIMWTNFDFVETSDLYLLIGNILDNAVEHSIESEIKFSIYKEGGFIIIRTENYIIQNNQSNIKTLIASIRKQNQGHGFGITTIKDICKKYRGMAFFEEQGEIFVVTACIRSTK